MMFQPIDKELAPLEPPHSMGEVVELILNDLSLRDKVVMANLSQSELRAVYPELAQAIQNEFGLPGRNRQLTASIRRLSRQNGHIGEEPAMTILREIWKRVKKTHMLRVVK